PDELPGDGLERLGARRTHLPRHLVGRRERVAEEDLARLLRTREREAIARLGDARAEAPEEPPRRIDREPPETRGALDLDGEDDVAGGSRDSPASLEHADPARA